jgi:hypothetical protein
MREAGQNRISYHGGHQSQLSISSLNVEAKEFDPTASFNSQPVPLPLALRGLELSEPLRLLPGANEGGGAKPNPCSPLPPNWNVRQGPWHETQPSGPSYHGGHQSQLSISSLNVEAKEFLCRDQNHPDHGAVGIGLRRIGEEAGVG